MNEITQLLTLNDDCILYILKILYLDSPFDILKYTLINPYFKDMIYSDKFINLLYTLNRLNALKKMEISQKDKMKQFYKMAYKKNVILSKKIIEDTEDPLFKMKIFNYKGNIKNIKFEYIDINKIILSDTSDEYQFPRIIDFKYKNLNSQVLNIHIYIGHHYYSLNFSLILEIFNYSEKYSRTYNIGTINDIQNPFLILSNIKCELLACPDRKINV